MRRLVACATIVVAVAAMMIVHHSNTQAKEAKAPMLIHGVYFTLKDPTPANKKKLVDACYKYLAKHDGEVFFSAGTRAEDLAREVNDKDFDVGLLIAFKTKADQEKYQVAARHKQFIAENQASWKKVRVFDCSDEQ